jgi:hypothetical protein
VARRLVQFLSALAVSPAAAAAAVFDPVAIGPDQDFLGQVNGSSADAVIQIGCFGPVTPGETGHPLAGQSTDVELVNPASATPVRPGFTGDASEIEAVLTWPSPTSTLPVVLGTFSDYFVKDPISTSLNLPCYGSGTVTFVPLNGGPTAVSWREIVSFVGQP